MRIIAGTLKGRTFFAPAGTNTRPTTDVVREALFDALASRCSIEGAIVLDLCCGSGALSFEALSRGALSSTCIDVDPAVCKLVRASAQTLGVSEAVTVIAADVPRVLADIALVPTIVFYDAPYALMRANQTVAAISKMDRVPAGGMVVLEHGQSEVVLAMDGWEQSWLWQRGGTVITMLRRLEK
jgi:16S rRNA (guanine966-N2)-methyltransferase